MFGKCMISAFTGKKVMSYLIWFDFHPYQRLPQPCRVARKWLPLPPYNEARVFSEYLKVLEFLLEDCVTLKLPQTNIICNCLKNSEKLKL